MKKSALLGRLALIALVSLGLAGRILVPAGFMPAPLGDGWPIKLCPGVPGNEFLLGAAAEHGGHHDSHHGSDHGGHHGDHGPDERGDRNPCPVGSVFSSAALMGSEDPPITLPRGMEALPAITVPVTGTSTTSAQPRAPPSPLPSPAA